jgi:23S rRNA (guanine2445-N2)-methyltransferase / 23S rRNA (guanine2069-N7)-methyltransferase
MFANRLRKNLRTIGAWARRQSIDCYRLYDADIPEYALAVDLYRGESLWVHCQEYAAPRSVDPVDAARRLEEAMATIPELLGVPEEQVFLKVRQRQKGTSQYQKLAQRGRFHEVREDHCRLLVNFTDYLDTGLFLDHRLTRALAAQLARGRKFLNLFAYTASATVHAALGGAATTTTVDMSRTYLDWAQRNLALNGIAGPEHLLIQADCLEWLEQANRAAAWHRYGVIFLDPPTFSSSKRMRNTFEVQRDHPRLIRQALHLLEPGGTLIFSNNYRRFRMDPPILEEFVVEDITARTLPRDFARNPRIHNCWLLRTLRPDAQTKPGKPHRAQAGSGTAPESARPFGSEPTLPPRPRC